ncbi:MAG TPA: VWA domain-containing protein [Pyrinomonadaceae bacterium]|jgi:VWFA-related protein|nr:VWA domain-containing protein [Pyrinomonadaceae bacterium]
MRTEERKTSEKRTAPSFCAGLLSYAALCLLLAVCLSATSSRVRAQSTTAPQSTALENPDEADTIRVDTDLVDLNVSVFSRDRRNRVGQLQQSDFAVFENGTPVEIAFFASATTPFDLVLMLDLSGSTSDKLELVRKSARRFVEAARPVDRISIVTFSNAPRLVAPLMTDHDELISRIKKIEKPSGGTNFWDSLGYVLMEVLGNNSRGAHRRSAVVVMTDGVDNALPDVPGDGSYLSFAALMETVRRAGAIVLPIYLDTEEKMLMLGSATRQAFFLARQQLAILADESGGILYSARRLEDLKGVYKQVMSDLSTVYSIGYRPRNRRRDGTWRAVAVRLAARPDLAARTRPGYYAK